MSGGRGATVRSSCAGSLAGRRAVRRHVQGQQLSRHVHGGCCYAHLDDLTLSTRAWPCSPPIPTPFHVIQSSALDFVLKYNMFVVL